MRRPLPPLPAIEIEKLSNVRPTDLPAPPESALRVVRAASEQDCDARRLARLVETHPVLAFELLRLANSAHMGFGSNVQSVARATALVGARAVRGVALCFAVRESIHELDVPGLDATQLWEDAIWRGVAARTVAPLFGVDPDDAFTVGLMQDVGLCALLALRPEAAPFWPRLRAVSPAERLEVETWLFGARHDHIGRIFPDVWSLPSDIADAIARHHEPPAEKSDDESHLGRIAEIADWIAWAFVAEDETAAFDQAVALIAERTDSGAEVARGLLVRTEQNLHASAPSYGLMTKRRPTFEDVIAEAATLSGEAEPGTTDLREALADVGRLAQQLRAANRSLEQMAFEDALTGLANRRRFMDLFLAEVESHAQRQAPLGLLMVDLDHFKQVNDTRGHSFGDAVLESVADVLRRATRPDDLLARIGGEELAILLPNTDAAGTRATSERIRAAIEGAQHGSRSHPTSITASIGTCTWQGAAGQPPRSICTRILDNADIALYQSKSGGRNRVTHASYEAECDTGELPRVFARRRTDRSSS